MNNAPVAFRPDPIEVQIASMVIKRRAQLLPLAAAVSAHLTQLSEDHLHFGRMLAGHLGEPLAEEVTPSEVFCDTHEFLGLMQSVSCPLGAVTHFRLTSRDQADRSRLGPTPRMARSVAVVDLIQHPN